MFFPLDDVHVFPENDRVPLPEDTVHMQELRRLHINDEHRRPHYRHPPGEIIEAPTYSFVRGTKRLVSVTICSVEGNSAGIFDSKVSPGIFVVKEK